MAEDIARHHHERWDGHGYPDGIFGSAIPLAARIVAVCDVYDAMTHDKAYRRALSSDEAMAEMLRGRALQFDPKLIDLFGPMISRLRAEHADFDAFLGQAARQTALTVARQKIAESLARPIEGVEADRQRIWTNPAKLSTVNRNAVGSTNKSKAHTPFTGGLAPLLCFEHFVRRLPKRPLHGEVLDVVRLFREVRLNV